MTLAESPSTFSEERPKALACSEHSSKANISGSIANPTPARLEKTLNTIPKFVFFLINKPTENILDKGCLKGDSKHTGSIQEPPKDNEQKRQALTDPQQEPNQSTKLIKEKGPTSRQDLAHKNLE